MLRTTPSAVLMLALGALAACTSDKAEDSAGDCQLPLASAGIDQAVALGDTVSLDGSGSSVCQTYKDAGTAKFTWTIDSVPVGSAIDASALSDNKTATAITPSFVPDVEGDYVVGLSVSDPAAASSADLVVISVVSGDQAPVADCGDDQSAEVGDRVEFDGSASADPEGAELTYSWSISSGPECTELDSSDIYNSGGALPTLVPDCEGIYAIALVVSDGSLWSEPDYCSINVASGNRLPVADAGDNSDLPACSDNPLQLDGWGSYDLDADDLEYQWSVVSVPSSSTVTDADFNDPTEAAPYITWDVAGSYTFQLEVYDGQDWSAPDVVTYVISDGSENTSPVANAGDDVTLAATADCTSASYAWTCGDCPATSSELDGSASEDADGDEITYYWSESTNSVTFSNRFSAITDIVVPAQPGTFGVDSSTVFEVNLDVADCLVSDNNTVTVTYTCTGEAS